MLRELPAEDAEYASLQAPTTVPMAAIQAALPEGALLVEYFRIEDRFVAALVTRSSLEIHPVAGAAGVAERLRLLRFQLSKFRLGADYVAELHDVLLAATNAHLHELYRELIAPIRDRMHGRHVIFVPHDAPAPGAASRALRRRAHLIDSFSVSYAPSATLYALCHGKPPSAGGGSLVLGVPDPLAPLIRDEVQTVAAVVPRSDLYFGADATEEVRSTHGRVTAPRGRARLEDVIGRHIFHGVRGRSRPRERCERAAPRHVESGRRRELAADAELDFVKLKEVPAPFAAFTRA